MRVQQFVRSPDAMLNTRFAFTLFITIVIACMAIFGIVYSVEYENNECKNTESVVCIVTELNDGSCNITAYTRDPVRYITSCTFPLPKCERKYFLCYVTEHLFTPRGEVGCPTVECTDPNAVSFAIVCGVVLIITIIFSFRTIIVFHERLVDRKNQRDFEEELIRSSGL